MSLQIGDRVAVVDVADDHPWHGLTGVVVRVPQDERTSVGGSYAVLLDHHAVPAAPFSEDGRLGTVRIAPLASAPKLPRLGHTQVLALRLLAEGPKTAQHLEYDHFGPSANAFRSALLRLGHHGLVDMAGWDHQGRRTYRLTDKGREVERALNVDPLEDE